MYNDRRYSLTRYSVSRDDKTVAVVERFNETVGVDAGAAVPVYVRERYAEALRGSPMGTVSIIARLKELSELDLTVRMSADVLVGDAFFDGLSAAAYGQKNIPAVLSFLDAMSAKLYAGKDIPSAVYFADAMAVYTFASKDVLRSLYVSEVLTALMEATSQTTERATFQLTIPPGGELRIDSGLYTVLLDGKNALHTQSGDWINISRDLLRIAIESASGGQLSGQLIYTERYL